MASTVISRLLMLLNTCINPVIYATTIPEFKELLRAFFKCNLASKLDEMMQDQKEVSVGWYKSMSRRASQIPSRLNCLSSPRNVDKVPENISCNDDTYITMMTT